MNQKHQVGGSGKGIVKIKPSQRNPESYGLPSVKDYSTQPLDKAPKALAGTNSLEDALKRGDELLLEGQEWRWINTPHEPVIIHRQHLRHMFIK